MTRMRKNPCGSGTYGGQGASLYGTLSDVLPFSGLWYLEIAAAIDYAKHRSRAHGVVTHVCDAAGKLIEPDQHKGDFKSGERFAAS